MGSKRWVRWWGLATLGVAVAACSGEGDEGKLAADDAGSDEGGAEGAAMDAGEDAAPEEDLGPPREPLSGQVAPPPDCPVVISEADCDESLRPIVFVHGTFGSGDNIAHVAKLFGSNGYCQKRFVAIDYNSTGGNPAAKIDAAIADVLEETGMDQVDLMGHSQGAGHAYRYLTDPDRAATVAHYIHLAGMPADAPPAENVEVLALSSRSDAALGVSEIGGAESHVFDELDHMAVASSTAAFVQMYEFLMGEEPEYTEVQCGDEKVTLGGVVVSFGDNVPGEGITIEMYELGDEPMKRGKPYASQVSGPGGRLEPIELERGVAYESRAVDADGDVIGHQYIGPQLRDDYLLRALIPSRGLLTGAVTSVIERDDSHSVIIARTLRGAFRKDLGDTLLVDGEDVLLEEIANAGTTTVGYFLFDKGSDRKTELSPLVDYSFIPFVEGVDLFVNARQPGYVRVQHNDQEYRVPAWPSESEGLTVVVFQ